MPTPCQHTPERGRPPLRRLLTVTVSAFAGAALLTASLLGLLALQGPPQHAARIDEANLELAKALAERDRVTAGRGVTVSAAASGADRWEEAANELPQAEVLAEQVWTVLRPPPTDPEATLVRPVQGPVVSGFGLRAWPDFGRMHPGLDIVNVPGTSIRAAADGVVAAIRADRARGKAVLVDHGTQPGHPGRWTTLYGHLEEITVTEGQRLRAGEEVGTLGNTGQQTTGPHLHFEVHIEGQPVDPRRWLR